MRLILILFLIWSQNAFAGKGTNCELVVDKATVSRDHGWIKFEVYNPTDSTIIMDGIKYFKSNEFWREYKDIVKSIYSKTDGNFTHYVKTDSSISFILQCHKLEIYKPPARSAIETLTPKKTWAQELIIKILR